MCVDVPPTLKLFDNNFKLERFLLKVRLVLKIPMCNGISKSSQMFVDLVHNGLTLHRNCYRNYIIPLPCMEGHIENKSYTLVCKFTLRSYRGYDLLLRLHYSLPVKINWKNVSVS